MARIDITVTFSVGLYLLHILKAFHNDAGVTDLWQGVGEGAVRVIS